MKTTTLFTLLSVATLKKIMAATPEKQEDLLGRIFLEPYDVCIAESGIDKLPLLNELEKWSGQQKPAGIKYSIVNKELKNTIPELKLLRALIRGKNIQSLGGLKKHAAGNIYGEDLGKFNQQIETGKDVVREHTGKKLVGKNFLIIGDPIFMEALVVSLIQSDKTLAESVENNYSDIEEQEITDDTLCISIAVLGEGKFSITNQYAVEL